MIFVHLNQMKVWATEQSKTNSLKSNFNAKLPDWLAGKVKSSQENPINSIASKGLTFLSFTLNKSEGLADDPNSVIKVGRSTFYVQELEPIEKEPDDPNIKEFNQEFKAENHVEKQKLETERSGNIESKCGPPRPARRNKFENFEININEPYECEEGFVVEDVVENEFLNSHDKSTDEKNNTNTDQVLGPNEEEFNPENAGEPEQGINLESLCKLQSQGEKISSKEDLCNEQPNEILLSSPWKQTDLNEYSPSKLEKESKRDSEFLLVLHESFESQDCTESTEPSNTFYSLDGTESEEEGNSITVEDTTYETCRTAIESKPCEDDESATLEAAEEDRHLSSLDDINKLQDLEPDVVHSYGSNLASGIVTEAKKELEQIKQSALSRSSETVSELSLTTSKDTESIISVESSKPVKDLTITEHIQECKELVETSWKLVQEINKANTESAEDSMNSWHSQGQLPRDSSSLFSARSLDQLSSMSNTAVMSSAAGNSASPKKSSSPFKKIKKLFSKGSSPEKKNKVRPPEVDYYEDPMDPAR